MPNTSTDNKYKMYFWMLLTVVVFVAALFFLKKVGFLMMNGSWLPKEAVPVVEDQIDNKAELQQEGQKLDQTDVDGSVNAQLKLLDQDAAGL